MQAGLVILHNEIHDMWFDWIKNSGLNVFGLHPVTGGSLDTACKSLKETVEFAESEKGKEFLTKLRNMGFSIETECHAISYLLPKNDLRIDDNWFRMDQNGERIRDANICASNEDALAFLGEKAGELALRLPADNNKYYLWQDDVSGRLCNCKDCKHLSPSDQVLKIMNAMLKGIRKVKKEAGLSFLAYLDTLVLPQKVEPEDGIFLEFAPYTRDLTVPIDDENCIKNKEYVKNIDELLAFFGKRNASVLEYWIDNSLLSHFKKPATKLPYNEEVIKRDIEFYTNKGFEKITSFAGYLDEEYCRNHGIPPVDRYAKLF